MKELYVKPEVEILLPLCEDIMTSSGELPTGPVTPSGELGEGVNPENAGGTAPGASDNDPDGDPDYSYNSEGVDEGHL